MFLWMMYVIFLYVKIYMKKKVYYGASQVYYGKSSTSCGPIRSDDQHGTVTLSWLHCEEH